MNLKRIHIKILTLIKFIISVFCAIYLQIGNVYPVIKIPDSWIKENLSSNRMIQQNIINKFNKLSSKTNNEDIILCLSKAHTTLFSEYCSYLINHEFKQKTTPMYCIFNTQGIKIENKHIPNITDIYLMRYYGVSTNMLVKKSITSFKFNTNSDIEKNILIKTKSSINYYNDILSKLKNNNLNKKDIIQELLIQIGITDNKILLKYPKEYLTNIPISQDDVTKCKNKAENFLKKCINNINISNYKIIQNSCIKYINQLNTIYKGKTIELIKQKEKLKEEIIKINRNNFIKND